MQSPEPHRWFMRPVLEVYGLMGNDEESRIRVAVVSGFYRIGLVSMPPTAPAPPCWAIGTR
jgi:hypothetical protein